MDSQSLTNDMGLLAEGRVLDFELYNNRKNIATIVDGSKLVLWENPRYRDDVLSLYEEEINNELANYNDLFAPKSDFEKTLDFEARSLKAQKIKSSG